ncbi:MAG: hypothetical protein OEO77_09110, partial [Acidimicrobiia bacterium]|nr:hypothetical protein [Acidimicrobiia bacterium]
AIIEEPVIAAGGVRSLDDLQDLMAIETGGRRLAGVIVGREVTHGRFTLEEARAVIALGPPETAAHVEPTLSPTSLEVIDGYRRIADDCEMAVAHARTAAQRYAEGERARGAAHGFSVHGHITRAGEILEKIARKHSEDKSG